MWIPRLCRLGFTGERADPSVPRWWLLEPVPKAWQCLPESPEGASPGGGSEGTSNCAQSAVALQGTGARCPSGGRTHTGRVTRSAGTGSQGQGRSGEGQ